MSEPVSSPNLGERFEQYFELVPALDDASRDAVFRIRHEVYCRDLGWEPLREDGMERDTFDRHSIHLLLRTRDTHEPVGCTRLILVPADAPTLRLPFEVSCAGVLHRERVDPAKLPRHALGEVSRLAVMRDFRQRKGEELTSAALAENDFRPRGPQTRFPFIPVSLYLGIAAIAHHIGLDCVFVLTEPRLATHFSRIGLSIEAIGDSIEHRGTRVPSMFRASTFVPQLRPMIRPLYEVIEARVKTAFQHAGR